MDFKSLNAAAVGKYPETIRLNDLPINKTSPLNHLKVVKTQKLGTQLIAHIPGNKSFFLPEQLVNYLRANDAELESLKNLAKRGSVTFKPLGASGMKFHVKNINNGNYKHKYEIKY